MKIATILFDIGGVLSHDGHETYLTHEVYGLALNLGLPNDEIKQKVNPIFRKYAVMPQASEIAFWDEIGKTLGIKLSPEKIDTVKKQVAATNPEAIASFRFLQEHGIKIGIISNSLPFFYSDQVGPLDLGKWADPNMLFLSHKIGRLKSTGLFEIAATKLNPSSTFIIEDRAANVENAQKLGFNAALYSIDNGDSLLALTKKIITDNNDAE